MTESKKNESQNEKHSLYKFNYLLSTISNWISLSCTHRYAS